MTSDLTLIRRGLGADLPSDLASHIAFAVGGAKLMDALITGLLDYCRTGRNAQGSRFTVIQPQQGQSLS